MPDLERRVLEGIKQRLLAPDAVAEFLAEYHAERKRLNATLRRDRHQIEKRLGVLDRQISNIIDSIADGAATAGMKTRLIEMEAEKERLASDLAAISDADNVVEMHPASIEVYRRKIAGLQEALHSNEDDRQDAVNAIRSLVTSIEVMPRDERGKFDLTVNGELAELLNLPRRKPGELPNTAMMVAEEGLEPPTHGL